MATKRINREINVEDGSVTFTELASGNSVVASLADFSEAMVRRLALHGMNGKFGDSAANPDVDAIPTITSVIDAIKGGEWTHRGDGASPKMTDLATALMTVTGQDEETVLSKLADMSDEQKKDLRGHVSIKAAIAEIKKTREAAKAKAAKTAAADAAPLEF